MKGWTTTKVDSLALVATLYPRRDKLPPPGNVLQFAQANVCGVLSRLGYGCGSKRGKKRKFLGNWREKRSEDTLELTVGKSN